MMKKVSRETYQKFEEYAALLLKWNSAINLIGKSTESIVFERHIEDALRLAPYLDIKDKIVDLGSGAGIPGIILSIIGHDLVLIDSDTRKCAFLLKAKEALGLNYEILNTEAEKLNIQCDVLTCRAFASINKILNIANQNIIARKKILLLKGSNVESEIVEAKKIWLFNYDVYNNIASDSKIITIDPTYKKL